MVIKRLSRFQTYVQKGKALCQRGFAWWFPPQCVRCAQTAAGFLCADCAALCPPLAAHCACCTHQLYDYEGLCGRCLHKPPPIDALYAAKRFVPAVRDVVLAMKFARSRTALRVCQQWLEDYAQTLVLPHDAVLMPLPLAWLRLTWRGFNQADALMQGLQRPQAVVRGVLRRHFRVPQSLLRTHRARQRNIQSAFYTVGAVPKRIVLIDDVVTSGATVHAAARVLKQNGAEWVAVLCVAAKQ